MTGKELEYINQAHLNLQLAGNGVFTKKCNSWLEAHSDSKKALLTHSCTAALEMSGILANLDAGDEVIMPSYTFVSTANAFVLRGAIPVFVDIRSDTLNLDENLIENAITKKTRAIVPVHYAGVACEMDKIMLIAQKYNLLVIEDAAQGIMSSYKGRALGSIGHVGCLSFHETKNITCGEGGALLINDDKFIERSEVIWEKGTNRKQFFHGNIDKYTWVDQGSSYLPGEISAAFLAAQMEKVDEITASRLAIWNRYHSELEHLEILGKLRRPKIPNHCTHNGHLYFIVLESAEKRAEVMRRLEMQGIHTVFHYIPLHDSPAGKKYGRYDRPLNNTNNLSSRLLRLPIWVGFTIEQQTYVTQTLKNII